ncbi:hypothetical protein PO909_013646 [Leuciscus waleckii]
MDEQFTEVDRLRETLLEGLEMADKRQEDISREDVLSRIENVIQTMVISVSKGEAPMLKVMNRSSWTNVRIARYKLTIVRNKLAIDFFLTIANLYLTILTSFLRILATSKGFISGDLCYLEEDGTKVDCNSSSTGKGMPDVNSRLMVRKLWDALHVPVFALVDADPHGNRGYSRNRGVPFQGNSRCVETDAMGNVYTNATIATNVCPV